MARLKDTEINGNLYVSDDTNCADIYGDNIRLGSKTDKFDGNTGVLIQKTGEVDIQHNSYPEYRLTAGTNTSANGGIAFSLGINGTLVWSTGNVLLHNSTGKQLQFNTDRFRPNANDMFYLGDSGNKWKAVYATTGTIQTSDRNQKENIVKLDEKYENLFENLKPVSFKLKGSDHDRTHVGFISQDVEESLSDVGLTAIDFAGFCKSPKLTTDIDGQTYPVYDEESNPVYEYALRYEEFIALNTHMIKKANEKIAAQQDEIDALKEIVNTLKQDVENLKK